MNRGNKVIRFALIVLFALFGMAFCTHFAEAAQYDDTVTISMQRKFYEAVQRDGDNGYKYDIGDKQKITGSVITVTDSQGTQIAQWTVSKASRFGDIKWETFQIQKNETYYIEETNPNEGWPALHRVTMHLSDDGLVIDEMGSKEFDGISIPEIEFEGLYEVVDGEWNEADEDSLIGGIGMYAITLKEGVTGFAGFTDEVNVSFRGDQVFGEVVRDGQREAYHCGSLVGPKFNLVDEGGEVLVSWTEAYKGNLPVELGKRYTIELAEPYDGVDQFPPITFHIENDHLVIDEADEILISDHPYAHVEVIEELSDDAIDIYGYAAMSKLPIRISKVDIESAILPGACLSILDAQGDVVAEWTSPELIDDGDDEGEVIPDYYSVDLPVGTYTLVETSAPDGFKKIKPATFEVGEEAISQGYIIFPSFITVTDSREIDYDGVVSDDYRFLYGYGHFYNPDVDEKKIPEVVGGWSKSGYVITITDSEGEDLEPAISTKSRDKSDGDQVIEIEDISSPEAIIDTVSYTDLLPGEEYTMTATLIDKASGKSINSNNAEYTASKTFTPDASDGEIEIELPFTYIDMALIDAELGDTWVVFETCADSEGNIVAVHTAIDDPDQTVTIKLPEVPVTPQTDTPETPETPAIPTPNIPTVEKIPPTADPFNIGILIAIVSISAASLLFIRRRHA